MQRYNKKCTKARKTNKSLLLDEFFCFWAALCDHTFEEARVINRAPANLICGKRRNGGRFNSRANSVRQAHYDDEGTNVSLNARTKPKLSMHNKCFLSIFDV